MAARAAATPGEIAWVAALPCVALLLLAMLVLGPPLGRLAFQPVRFDFWPYWKEQLEILPEPSERAAYLLALAAPVVLSALVALGARRRVALPPAALRTAARVAQLLVPAALAVAIVAQQRKVFGYPYSSLPLRHVYFTPATLAVSALIALALTLALRSTALLARASAWTRETRGRRVAALLAAAALTALWLSTAINTDATVVNGHFRIFVSIPFWLDEPAAVLNGRWPLVDYNALYGHLLAYVAAVPLALFGLSLGVYSVTMATGSLLAMLALYAVLRRLLGRSLLALALFVPLLSTSFFTELGPPEDRHGPQTLFSVFPLRYLGAYALAWLTARHVAGVAPRRWLLFAAAGIVMGNNLEFGVPAFGATLVALVLADPSPSWARVGRLLADAALGLLVALAAISALTLAVAGSLPHFGLLLTFPRVFGLGYFSAMPMPKLGFHLAMYLTFAAALVLAAVRWSTAAEDRVLTAMLAWAGVFGLGAGSYYVGRSLPEVLISLFSIWAFALVLLTIAAVRAILARPGRRPTAPELAVLFALGMSICSIAQTPTPWSQVERLRDTSSIQPFAHPPALAVIRAATSPGEHVLILNALGHRIAEQLHLVNVAPYPFLNAMPLARELSDAVAALRAAGGTKLFLPASLTHREHLDRLEQEGFAVRDVEERADVIELVDQRGSASG